MLRHCMQKVSSVALLRAISPCLGSVRYKSGDVVKSLKDEEHRLERWLSGPRHPARHWFLSDPFFDMSLPALGPMLHEAFPTAPTRGIAADVLEKDNEFEIKADLPGVPKEAIKVDVEGDVLSISVEQADEKQVDEEQGGVKWHRVERSSKFQQRAMRLPETAVMDRIEAKYENGVLCIKVPKKDLPAPEGAKRIAVS